MTQREVERIGSLRYMPEFGEADQLANFDAIRNMQKTVMDIDATIFRYAQALEAVQPPTQGKIAIRFLKRQWGDSDSRHPQFVQWHKSTTGRWLYTRLKPGEVLRKLKNYGVFAITRDDAREILIQARTLVELRDSLMKSLGITKRSMAMHASKAQTAAAPYKDLIEQLIPKLEDRRVEIIMNNRDAKEYAAEVLPSSAKVESGTRPGIHPTGRTRGYRSVTNAREGKT